MGGGGNAPSVLPPKYTPAITSIVMICTMTTWTKAGLLHEPCIKFISVPAGYFCRGCGSGSLAL